MKRLPSTRWSIRCLALPLLTALAVPHFAADTQKYRVGDPVEAQPMNDWWGCVVTQVNLIIHSNMVGSYSVRCNRAGGSTGEYVVPTNRIRPYTGQVAQPVAGQRPAAVQAASAAPGQRSNTAPTGNGPGAKYEARDPATCASTKEPAQGAPSVAQAKKYVLCRVENEQGYHLYLTENLNLEIGKGRPINTSYLGGDRMPDADPSQPVYPLRGSYDAYMCTATAPNGNSGHNCMMTHFAEATGACWKTTFGDWACSLAGTGLNSTTKHGVPAPR